MDDNKHGAPPKGNLAKASDDLNKPGDCTPIDRTKLLETSILVEDSELSKHCMKCNDSSRQVNMLGNRTMPLL